MAPANILLVRVLAICILILSTLNNFAVCFSTPRAKASAKSSTRNIGTLVAEPESATLSNGNAYLANYITAIECDSPAGDERGLMVATTDHNYAIYSPTLKSRGWLTLAVNDDNVFIVTTKKHTLSTSLLKLDEQERDFIAELRSNFTQNLAGLKFATYTSGSSTYLTQPYGSSVASLAYSQLKYNNPAGHSVDSSTTIIPQGAASQGFVQIDSPKPIPTDRPSDSSLLQSNDLPPSAAIFFARTLGKGKRSFVPLRGQNRLVWRARNSYSPSMDVYNGPNDVQYPVVRPDVRKSLCSPDRLNDNFNYYNLLQAPLNVTLTGDVYYFDLHCNILDVYSTSVSVRQARGLSALYRDADFFSYARSGMPLAINRFFLSDHQVFFVYNDGSLLVKMDWMLDQAELDLVVEARQELRLVANWQGFAADLLSKSVVKKKS